MLDSFWKYPETIVPFFAQIYFGFMKLRPFSFLVFFIILFPFLGFQVFAAMNNFSTKQYSDTLKIGFIGNITNIDPYPLVPIIDPITAFERMFNRTVFDRLVDFNDNGVLENNLITGYSASKDFKTFTFNLRKDIKWSDGADFSAQDVKKSFDLVRSLNRGLFYTSLNDVEFQKIDDYQVEFKLKKGNSFFPETLVWPIVPAHIFNTNENYTDQIKKSSFQTTPVTTSEWVVDSRKSNSVILVKNSFFNRKQTEFNSIVFRSFETKKSIEEALQGKDIDIFFSNDAADLSEQVAKTTPISIIRQYYSLYFNLTDSGLPWAKDQNIRKALAYAINKKELFQDKYAVVSGPLPQESTYYNKDIEKYDFDLSKAASLLDTAGYKLVNGIRTKDNQPLKITLTVQENTPRVPIALDILKNWNALGVEVILDQESDTSVIGGELVHNGFATNVILPQKFDVVLYGIETPPGSDRFSLWHTIDKNKSGNNDTFSNNISGYKSNRVDINLENSRLDSDPAKISNDLLKFQKTLVDDVPVIFLFNSNIYLTYARQVENVNFNRIYSTEDLIVRLYDVKIIK